MNQVAKTDQTQGSSLVAIDQQYPVESYTRLFPTSTMMSEVGPHQRLTIETLTIDPDPSNKEVYEVAGEYVGQGDNKKWTKKYGLAKPTLDRVSHALGVTWVPEKCGRVDGRRDRDYCEYTAVGVVKKADGSFLILTGTKAVDIRAIDEELRFGMEEKARAGNFKKTVWENNRKSEITLNWGTPECTQEIDMRVRKRIVEVRKHMLAIAESGAKNRAVRSFGLKPAYTIEELSKPFIVPRIDINPNYFLDDPNLKGKVLEAAQTGAAKLFGDHNPEFSLPATASAPIEDHPTVEYLKPVEHDADITTSEENESHSTDPALARQEFENSLAEMSDADRQREFERLIKEKKLTFNGKPVNTSKFMDADVAKQIQNVLWAYDQESTGLPV